MGPIEEGFSGQRRGTVAYVMASFDQPYGWTKLGALALPKSKVSIHYLSQLGTGQPNWWRLQHHTRQ